MTAKNPSDTWFYNDWENAADLKTCSLAAQGLWMRLLCIAARSPERGVVQDEAGEDCSDEDGAEMRENRCLFTTCSWYKSSDPGGASNASPGSDLHWLLRSTAMAIEPSNRIPLSKRVRFEVFKRDGFVCQYCGQHPPDIMLEVDHITPVVEGGGNDQDNLITACFNCNRGKAHIPLSVVPKSLPEKAAEVEEIESQLAGYREVMQARADRIDADMWEIADLLVPRASIDGMRRDWLQSIKTFNARIPLHEVIEAAELARARVPYRDKPRFLYFCKVCWNKIKGVGDGQN